MVGDAAVEFILAYIFSGELKAFESAQSSTITYEGMRGRAREGKGNAACVSWLHQAQVWLQSRACAPRDGRGDRKKIYSGGVKEEKGGVGVRFVVVMVLLLLLL